MEKSGQGETAPRGKRSYLKAIPYLLLLVLIAAITLLVFKIKSEKELMAAEGNAATAEVKPPVNVVALELKPATIRDRLELPGTLKPWTTLNVVSEIGGRVIRKAVTEGQKVAPGDILVELDAREYRNQYRSAQAAHQTAQTNLKRFEHLQTTQATTQAKLDEARTQVAATRATMDNAALAVERCTIRAAIGGVINRLPVEIGHYLNKGDPVAELLQLNRLKVVVGIPESDVDAVRRLETFTVTIDALDGKTTRGRKHHLSRTTDQMARLYDLQLEVPNPDGEILPDMFARIEIVKTVIQDGIAVPLYSIVSRQNGQVVYVVEGDRARERRVSIGMLDGWRCEVKEGLSIGERVIVVGQRNVNDGQSVNVVRVISDPGEIAR
jgi:RND family efflux transporter MFP subunit